MRKETEILLKEYKKHYKYNKQYISANDWTTQRNAYETEKELVESMITSFSSFLESVETDRYLKVVQEFTEYVVGIINVHLSRIDQYLEKDTTLYDISEDIENLERVKEDADKEDKKGKKIETDLKKLVDTKKTEVKFRSDIFTQKIKVKTKLSNLNLVTDGVDGSSPNIYHGNMKASLLMRPVLVEVDQYIKTRTDGLELDFSVPHINPATSNEMLINMNPKDIPPYDINKHFFEQEKSTIQFWEEEKNKMRNGITIGGYHIHPFLYWHLNIYKGPIGTGENKRVANPLFWDNDYYFIETLKEAEEHGSCGIFLYGSRRTSKSFKMASYSQWKLHTIPHAKGNLIGFSTKDLTEIWDYAKTNIEYMYPAFKVDALTKNMEDGVVMGVRKKNASDTVVFGQCKILNLEGGSKAGNLKTAGGSPDFLLIDEGAKGHIIKPWNTALASFSAADKEGWRTIPIISATAGEEQLSRDAEKILADPEAYSVLPMNWDLYDEHIPKEYQTWEKEKFTTFVPAQMSLEAPVKIESNLGEFLGKPDSELSKVTMYVTDWKNASKYFLKRQEDLKRVPEQLANEQKNFPIRTSDCLISTEFNKYPAIQAKQHKNHILENDLIGRPVMLEKGLDGKIVAKNSNRPIIMEYPFSGGNYEAPVVILDEIEDDKLPKFGLYVIGLDDVKHKKSDGDSLFSVTMFKRGYEGGPYGNRFAAYYHTRPYRKEDGYKQTYLLMKKYNAIVFPENDDEGFVEYVERNYPEDLKHIASGIDFAKLNNMHRNSNREYGMSTDPRNIYYIERKLEFYTKRENVIVDGIDGLTGIQSINDPMLLEEMIRNKPGVNADRIRSAALAYAYADFLDKYNIHIYLSDYNYPGAHGRRDEPEVEMGTWMDDEELEMW